VQLCVVSLEMKADVVLLQDELTRTHVDAKEQGTENRTLNAAVHGTTEVCTTSTRKELRATRQIRAKPQQSDSRDADVSLKSG